MGTVTQLLCKLGGRESRGTGTGHGIGNNAVELPLAFRSVAGRFLFADERPGSLVSFELPGEFEFLVRPDDGIRINRKIDGKLADSGELVSHDEGSGCNRATDLVDDLAVDGNAALEVEVEAEGVFAGSGHRRNQYTITLVH